MPEQHRRRLTSLEASFLYCEKSHEPIHIGGCSVYEGQISRATLLRLLEERLHLLPRYRQKVVCAPFGVAHPSWEDDPQFDLSRHVEEVTLPPPGDEQTLSTFGGQLFARPLDRAQPLWKLILVHGRQDANTAIIAKVHYAMVEGISGTGLSTVLHDLKPRTDPPPPPSEDWKPTPMPDFLALFQDALRDTVTRTVSGWTDESFRLVRSLRDGRSPQQQFGTAMLSSLLRPVPCVSFNGPLSAERQFAWAEFSYPEIRTIRSILGGTVNDVVLTIIAGGLGRYLHEHGKNTDNLELRVACPVMLWRHGPSGHATSESSEAALPLSAMFLPLYPGIADPVLRFSAEREAMEEIRAHNQAQTFAGLQTVSRLFPPALQALSTLLVFPHTVTNTVSLNIPGPQIPLYLAGHKRLALYPIGPLTTNIGLFHATASYNQKLTIGVTVDPHLVPDVWHYTECLQTSFHDLHAAAQRVRQQPASQQTTQQVA